MGAVARAVTCLLGLGLIAAACTGSGGAGSATAPLPSSTGTRIATTTTEPTSLPIVTGIPTWATHYAEWEAGAVVTAEDVTELADVLRRWDAAVLLPAVVPRQTTMSLDLLEHSRTNRRLEVRLELSGPPYLLLTSSEPDPAPQDCSDEGWTTIDLRGVPACHRMAATGVHVVWSEDNRHLSVETGAPLEQLHDELAGWVWLSGDERTVGNFPPGDTTVITGDIGSIAHTSKWPPGAEPGDTDVTSLADELARARVPLLVPLGAGRPDRSVTVEITRFILHPDGAIVRVSDDLGRPVLSLRTLPLADFWARACPFFPDRGTNWGSIRIRGTTACHTRAKGEITRIEWSEADRAVIVTVSNGDGVPEWLGDWVWLPSQDG